jgi:endoglucanase
MKNIIYYFVVMLATACSTADPGDQSSLTPEDHIRINQVGYYSSAPKVFVAVDAGTDQFELIAENRETVFAGTLSDAVFWESSGENVRRGDFSEFTSPGSYRIRIAGAGESHPFVIGESIYDEAAKAALKSNYFQRCSMPIEETFGGKFARPAGHPDTNCLYHPSTGYESGGKTSPGGWYDAGDYGKYIVNAGISVGTMLVLQELYPQSYGDQSLNIPESGNGINDLMDEMRYETDWMLTMQDTDGGVFHKLTTLQFTGFVMPHETTEQRYFIGKSTAAALNLAAVMAMMKRLYAGIDQAYAEICLAAAEKAWNWAVDHPEEYFSNPSDVSTGAYGDTELQEEFFWAAAELYITTGNEDYLSHIDGKLDRLTFRIEKAGGTTRTISGIIPC